MVLLHHTHTYILCTEAGVEVMQFELYTLVFRMAGSQGREEEQG